MVTVLGDGIVAGGVYSPVVEMVPTELEPPTIPFTSQVTVELVEFATVALSCAVEPSRTWPAPLTVTCTWGVTSVAELLAQPARLSAQPIERSPAIKPSKRKRRSEER
jgi:hypothetical protein